MFAKENERGGRGAKGPQSTSDATSENQDTGTSAPSFVSVYRYAVLFASSLTAYARVIQLNCLSISTLELFCA